MTIRIKLDHMFKFQVYHETKKKTPKVFDQQKLFVFDTEKHVDNTLKHICLTENRMENRGM